MMVNVLSALCGEIDLLTAGTFRDDLYEIIDQCNVPIVRVDLQAVTFMDSAGYHALVDADEYAIRRGHIMSIRNLSAQCAKVIGICDLDNDLHIEDLASASH
jgi:anti-anti-sigma factor